MCVNFPPFFTGRGKKIFFPLVLGILCLILPCQFPKLPYSTYHHKRCKRVGISLSNLNSNDLHLKYYTTGEVKWTHLRHDVNNKEVKMHTQYYWCFYHIQKMTEEISTQSQQDGQCTHTHNTEVYSHNNCCHAKAVLCILSVCSLI